MEHYLYGSIRGSTDKVIVAGHEPCPDFTLPAPPIPPDVTVSAPERCQQDLLAHLNAIEHGYYQVDLGGNITGFNRQVAEMLGYGTRELMGMNNRVFMDAATARQAFITFNRVYRTGRSTQGHAWQLIRKDGSPYMAEVSASLIRDEKGHPVGFIGVVHHQTAQQNLARLIKQKEQAFREEERRRIEMQTALRVLMQNQDELQEEFSENMLTQVKTTVLPHLEWLLEKKLSAKARARLLLMRSNLHNLLSPFARRMTSAYYGLTRTELEVADLVKHGRSNKEIAAILGLSLKTVETHRNKIRRKLGINNTKTNLRTYLQSLAN